MPARLGCTVDASGISAPPYSFIFGNLQDGFRTIWGSDIYIDADTQDGQQIGIFAQAINDSNQSCIATYNNFSPSTAVGAGLSSVVKVNGIRRQVSSNSTAVVTAIGQPGKSIPAGLIGDSLGGTQWSTPAFTFPAGGEIDITATCTAMGAITAGAGSLTSIVTPFPGWQTVTNALPAVPGAPVESDAQLRRRQSRSASLPADTTLNGIYSAVANVTGVQRAAVYQNDTNITDANGIPPHNISVVVEGGTSGDIAAAIALKKPPGIPMFGNASVIVVDSRGVPDTIKYFSLREVGMWALVFLTPLTSYVSTTEDRIKASLAQFYNDQDIGQDPYLTRAYAPANLTGESAEFATGMTQSQLDTLAPTFRISALAQSSDDLVTTGAYPAGTDTVELIWSSDFQIGDIAYIDLDDLSHQLVIITDVVPGIDGTITFTPVVPIGRSILAAARVYRVGDAGMNFAEAAAGSVDRVTVVVA